MRFATSFEYISKLIWWRLFFHFDSISQVYFQIWIEKLQFITTWLSMIINEIQINIWYDKVEQQI